MIPIIFITGGLYCIIIFILYYIANHPNKAKIKAYENLEKSITEEYITRARVLRVIRREVNYLKEHDELTYDKEEYYCQIMNSLHLQLKELSMTLSEVQITKSLLKC
jgi:hypothetical protein